MRSEDRFLLECLQATLAGAEQPLPASPATTEFDCQYFLDSCTRHGVGPWFYRRLVRDAARTPFPTAVATEFGKRAEAVRGHNLLLTAELHRITDLLEREGVPVVPLKGPGLSSLLYGDPDVREFSDLDLLVHREDVVRVAAAVCGHGYVPELSLSPRRLNSYLRNDCEYNFDHPSRCIHLELHWQELPRYFGANMDIESVWERLQTVSVGGKILPVPHPEDLLLMLCLHGSKHLWNALRWLLDVGLLLPRLADAATDWRRVLAVAEQARARRALLLGLFLARDLLGVRLPTELDVAARSDPALRTLAEDCVHLMFSDCELGMYKQHLLLLRTRDSWANRLQYAWLLAVTPGIGEWSVVDLPGRLAFLYYVLRPFRVVWRHPWRMLRL